MTMPIGRHVSKLSGYAPSLPTPFGKDGTIDRGAFERLCAFQVSEGATALIVASTTGEDWSLLPHEHTDLVRIAVSTARGVPVIAGANSNATESATTLAKAAECAGADAVISVVPYYNKPTQHGILAHFQALAASTGLPLILSDNPSRCVSRLSDETVVRLAAEPQFIGLEDCTGDLTRPHRLKSIIGERFRVFCGDDAYALPYLVSGGDGCLSVVSNVIPGFCRNMFLAYKQGHINRAQRIAVQIVDLTAAVCGDAHPANLKYALSLLEFSSPFIRPPLVEPKTASKAQIERIMRGIDDR